MSNIALEVENISKQYRLGEIGTGTLSHDLNRLWARVRGKDDPFLQVGEKNDRTKKSDSDYVWALKDVNFKVEQGDAVGIIGRNGAGKSTLLKLLSKVTAPTTGDIKVRGRIASLLEVGTGFHPEMTGRENIYLNGAILGMTKKEIKRKFDEIVDFSGVERYIDTPVKRYSSGMYVRLAFAVAAHLESEILIVDEVLAVGDAEFQKKCLGKMGDVSKGEGRTVLFVSHNMGAVRNLCNTGIFMEMGTVKYIGNVEDTVNKYLENKLNKINRITDFEKFKLKQNPYLTLTEIKITDHNSNLLSSYLPVNYNAKLFIRFFVEELHPSISIGFSVFDNEENIIFRATDRDVQMPKYNLGENEIFFEIPAHLLNEGDYLISIDASLHKQSWLIESSINAPSLNLSVKGYIGDSDLWNITRKGVVVPLINSEVIKPNVSY